MFRTICRTPAQLTDLGGAAPRQAHASAGRERAAEAALREQRRGHVGPHAPTPHARGVQPPHLLLPTPLLRKGVLLHCNRGPRGGGVLPTLWAVAEDAATCGQDATLSYQLHMVVRRARRTISSARRNTPSCKRVKMLASGYTSKHFSWILAIALELIWILIFARLLFVPMRTPGMQPRRRP